MSNSAFLIACFVSVIRYYDYALFGLSAHILAQNFLPRSTHETQLLAFFALLSTAVIIRPLGSIIFGYIGDRYGRTKSIKISMFISSISTLLIAITPSFDKIGIFATIMLTFCRMIFCASLAGDIDGIKVYVAEKTKNNQKNLGLGVVVSCTQLGALLAAMAYYCTTNLYYLWRINFVVGAIFGLFAILMRSYFEESRDFLHNKNKQSDNIPIFQILKNAKLIFTIALIIHGAIGGIYHFLVYFLGTFLAKIAFIKPIETEFMNIILIITYGMAAIFAGILADKINPLKQIIFALLLSLVTAFAIQVLLYQQIFTTICPIILIGLASFYAVPLQIIVQSLFKTAVRMRLNSLSHSLGGIILSSSTPFFSMLLWQNFKSLWVTFSFFIFLLIILTSAVIVLLSRGDGSSLQLQLEKL